MDDITRQKLKEAGFETGSVEDFIESLIPEDESPTISHENAEEKPKLKIVWPSNLIVTSYEGNDDE